MLKIDIVQANQIDTVLINLYLKSMMIDGPHWKTTTFTIFMAIMKKKLLTMQWVHLLLVTLL